MTCDVVTENFFTIPAYHDKRFPWRRSKLDTISWFHESLSDPKPYENDDSNWHKK